jgi:hypothetical protein
MGRIAWSLAFAGILTPIFCQDTLPGPGESKAMAAPALPFYEWNACPFEGCAYREWTARKATVVYDTWEEKRRQVASLSVGDKVIGVTGVVITYRPGMIRMDRDLPKDGLKRGDTILTYTNRGEGFVAAWLKGVYYSDFDISFTKWPDGGGCSGTYCAATYIDLGKVAWWAQVKLSSGRMGWVDMEKAQFDGMDLLATGSRLTATRA